MSFYEFILSLPTDVEDHLPSVPDSFMTWLLEAEILLPDWSDLEFDQIEMHHVTLGDKLFREMHKFWCGCLKKESKFFVQLEKGTDFTHLHCLLEADGVKSMVVGRYLNQIKENLIKRIFRGTEPKVPNWLAATKTKSEGGANKLRSQSYIPAYLLPKSQPELQWAWTNIEGYKKATLILSELARLLAEHGASRPASAGLQLENGPVIKTKQSQNYMELVNWLVENGITSEKQWIQENQNSYLSFNVTSNERAQIKSALDNSSEIMSLTKSAPDYLVGADPPEDLTQNRIYQLFQMNNYDPAYAGSILLGWCQRSFNKRNAVWLFGPATTGKTNLAEAIAHTMPFYGCVNWTNENFPFNNCFDKLLIWWEAGKMTAKVVEPAKAIFGGSKVCVDQKCKVSQQIDATPVIITSNRDMCMVVDGNSTTFEHKQPLEDRMFRFVFSKRLEPDFGKITKREVKEFFKWAELNLREIRHEFIVKHALSACVGSNSVKCPAPCDKGYKSPEKRPRLSVAAEIPIEVDVIHRRSGKISDYLTRYPCPCEFHADSVKLLEPCVECEYLNRKKNGCLDHGVTNCPKCHGLAPWDAVE
uniref:Uncharacterized protein n=1 Tax=Elephas maximus TaxID=9783 RepID=A0A348AYV6_ELEMA|nr:hypothetical protein [Elephas maximus]